MSCIITNGLNILVKVSSTKLIIGNVRGVFFNYTLGFQRPSLLGKHYWLILTNMLVQAFAERNVYTIFEEHRSKMVTSRAQIHIIYILRFEKALKTCFRDQCWFLFNDPGSESDHGSQNELKKLISVFICLSPVYETSVLGKVR